MGRHRRAKKSKRKTELSHRSENSSYMVQDSVAPPPTPYSSRTGVGENLSRLELEAKILRESSDDDDEDEELYKDSQQSIYSDTETNHFSCSPVLILIIIINIVSATLIILTSIQLYRDEQWNSIIQGKKGFEDLSTGQVFFKGKGLNVAPAFEEMVDNEKLRDVILRDSVVPYSYLAAMANFVLISILHAIVIYADVLHSFTESSKWTSFTYMFLGLLSIGTCVLMNHLTIKEYEENTVKAAHYFFKGKQITSLSPSKLLLKQNDEQILGSIFSICAYFSTEFHSGKHNPANSNRKKWDYQPAMDVQSRSISIYLLPSNNTEIYTVEDLSILGFCRDTKLSTTIYILSIILPIICWAIPILNAIRGLCCHRWLKKVPSREAPHKTMTQTDKWTPSYPPTKSNRFISNASSRARIYPDEAYQ